VTTSQESGPDRAHSGCAIGDTAGIDSPGAPVLQLITSNHRSLTDTAVADVPGYHVFVQTPGRPRAVCGCGWSGRKRFMAAGARLDAWLHAAQARHTPATRLTL